MLNSVMHPIQEKLLRLSKTKNLAKLTLRGMAKHIDMPNESPQKIKHHLQQLQKKGFLSIDRAKGMMSRASLEPAWAKGLLKQASRLFSIPIIGTANCGPATIFAEQNLQGLLCVDSKPIGKYKPTCIHAVKADCGSIHRPYIGGRKLEDGDFAIVDTQDRNVVSGNVVLAIIDDRATIKRFIDDRANGQIVLVA